jgi:hypothetical protein
LNLEEEKNFREVLRWGFEIPRGKEESSPGTVYEIVLRVRGN